MNRSVEQALTSLIPRHNGTLPPELLELASSLLAQSRSKASNLRAEEEIGRTYACANIACERLKQLLNLPKIEPRPPCPPRIYAKLYAYFDGLLVPPRRSRSTKESSVSAAATPAKTRSLPSRPTPTKDANLTPYKTTPSRAPSSRRRGLHFSDSTTEIPVWIHPLIRALCKELHTPAAAPHILAGVTTILTLPSPVSREQYDNGGKEVKDKKNKLPALVIAVNFFVGTRLSGHETTAAEYSSQRTEVLEVLRRLREDETLKEKVTKVEGAWEGFETVQKKDVDSWLQEISNRGWLKLDWFLNIVEGAGLEIENEEAGLDETFNEATEQRSSLQSGLGTMMQDRVDYLSDKKRADYQIWKKGIMARIEEIEQANSEEAIDTSDG